MKKRLFLLALSAVFAMNVTAQNSLKFRNGEFKIVQFTDIHYTVNNENAATSVKLMNDVLDAEKPDLVVLSGDIVVSKDMVQGWKELSEPIVSRKIPFVLTFGNHDDEGNLTREEIYNMVSKIEGNANGKNPENVTGYSNGAIEIKGKSGKTEAVCWIFDSNSYSKLKEVEGYGWFEPDQIAWYAKKSGEITATNGGVPVPSVAFFHIALPEHRTAYDAAEKKNIGLRGENECPPELNSGMFLQMLKCGDIMSVFVGHDHDNDYVANYKNILLGFGKFSGSKTTYTSKGSGARVFVLSEGKRELRTWIVNSDLTTEDSLMYPSDYDKGGSLCRAATSDSLSNVIGQQAATVIKSSGIDIDELSLDKFTQGVKNTIMQK